MQFNTDVSKIFLDESVIWLVNFYYYVSTIDSIISIFFRNMISICQIQFLFFLKVLCKTLFFVPILPAKCWRMVSSSFTAWLLQWPWTPFCHRLESRSVRDKAGAIKFNMLRILAHVLGSMLTRRRQINIDSTITSLANKT